MMVMQQLDALNKGEQVPTYMLMAASDEPVVGECRYLVPTIPAPGEPFAAMLPLRPQRIIFVGDKWVLA